MLKEPRVGRVKTRLGRDIGLIEATWWFRHQSNALLRRLGSDPRWRTVIAVSPDNSLQSRFWPLRCAKIPQGSGDLGARMTRMFKRAQQGPTIVIGGDIPGIRSHHIWSGFKALGSSDAVFGPAPDGGYWAIGLKGGSTPVPNRLFEGVRWSTKHALADTIQTFGPTACVSKIATLADVDTVEDLKAVSSGR